MSAQVEVYGITGHRPPRLGLGYDDDSRRLLREFAQEQLSLLNARSVITGMAQGWDQAVAEACIVLDIPFTAALPFRRMDAKWPQNAKIVFANLLDEAARVHIVCSDGYAAWKMLSRDEWIVNNSSKMLALFDGSKTGGTAHTVEYAIKQERQVVNAWDAWKSEARCKSV